MSIRVSNRDSQPTEKKCQVRSNNRSRVTYIVSTKSAPRAATPAAVLEAQRVEDATIEHALLGAQNVPADILDELDFRPSCVSKKPNVPADLQERIDRHERNVLHLKSFLNSLEILAHHWGLIDKPAYSYRE